jgi:hypothetical protein
MTKTKLEIPRKIPAIVKKIDWSKRGCGTSGRTMMIRPMLNNNPDNSPINRNLFPKRVLTAVLAPRSPNKLIPDQKKGFWMNSNISSPDFDMK